MRAPLFDVLPVAGIFIGVLVLAAADIVKKYTISARPFVAFAKIFDYRYAHIEQFLFVLVHGSLLT